MPIYYYAHLKTLLEKKREETNYSGRGIYRDENWLHPRVFI